MHVIEFCEKHSIPWFPLKLRLVPYDPPQYLEDGKEKMKKHLVQTGNNPCKTTDFDLRHDLVNLRKAMYHQSQESIQFTHIAMDTSHVRQIDIDCKNYATFFQELLKTHPYTHSTTKEYGRHIFVIDPSIPNKKKDDGKPHRVSQKFNKRYGKMQNGEPGVELLNGLWAWCPIDAAVHNADCKMETTGVGARIKKVRITKKRGNVVSPKEGGRGNVVPPQTAGEPPSNKNEIYYSRIRYNMDKIKVSTLTNYQKAAGIILMCASTQDKKIYDILQEVMSKAPNYSKTWVLEKWNEYDKEKHSNYHFEFGNANFYSGKINNASIAQLVVDLFGHMFLWSKPSKELFYWDGDLWHDETCADDHLHKLMKNDIYDIQHTLALEITDDDAKTFRLKRISLLHNRKFREETIKDFKSEARLRLAYPAVMNYNEKSKDYFQFNNGCLDLRTGKLRKREKTDYVSCKLSFDYAKSKKMSLAEVRDILRKMQPDRKEYDVMMRWKGYCLTGHTKSQQFMVNIGYTASNGKSTHGEMMVRCFPIYCGKIGNDAFELKNSTSHKSFEKLLTSPFRLVLMEEFGKKKQDNQKLKDFVDGKAFPIKPLYRKEVDIPLHAKLECSSNFDPNIQDGDEAIFRRGIGQYYRSKFVDGPENPEQHIYKKEDIGTLLEDDAFKLAYFNLLLPYAMEWYKHGLRAPKSNTDMFKKCVEDYDEFTEVFDKHFEITGDKDDIVSKKDVMYILAHTQFEHAKWRYVLAQFKRKGIMYDSQLRATVGKNRIKGHFLGLKIQTQDEDAEYDEDPVGI